MIITVHSDICSEKVLLCDSLEFAITFFTHFPINLYLQEEMTTVFKEMEGEDGKADVSTLLVHPKGRDIILHTPSYLLVVSYHDDVF